MVGQKDRRQTYRWIHSQSKRWTDRETIGQTVRQRGHGEMDRQLKRKTDGILTDGYIIRKKD